MAPALHHDIPSTIGAWLTGAIASVGLLGVTTLQCWMYYSNFLRDPIWLKVFVAVIWALEIARTVICVHGGYHYAIMHWGDIAILEASPIWSLEIMVLLTMFVTMLAHSFFAHQVWSLTRGKFRILFYIIATFALADFGFGIASYIAARVLGGSLTTILFGTPAHLATVALCCAIITDWTITGSLVCFLHGNRTRKTRSLMRILTVYAVNFGLLVSLTDLVVLVMTNYKWPKINFYTVGVFEVIGNFYANTILASLNSRTLVAEHLYTPQNLHFTSINAADINEVFSLEGRLMNISHDTYTNSVNQQQRQQRNQRRRASVEYQMRLSDSWSSSEGGLGGKK